MMEQVVAFTLVLGPFPLLFFLLAYRERIMKWRILKSRNGEWKIQSKGFFFWSDYTLPFGSTPLSVVPTWASEKRANLYLRKNLGKEVHRDSTK
jgi:hypothetical protein